MEDSNSIAGRRLTAIHSHLLTSTDNTHSQIETNSTAGEFFDDQRYSVVLPEKLKEGKWNVYRSARSPLKLLSRFPDHPEIETLHDSFYNDLEQLCNDPRAKAAVLGEMDVVAREAQLRGFEFAKVVTLVAEPFSVENGLLTPTFKVQRPQAKAYFAKEISNMYAELSAMDPTFQKPL